MKRTSVLATALVATLALGLGGALVANAAVKVKVKTKVNVNFQSDATVPPYYEEEAFFGRVKPKKVGRAVRNVEDARKQVRKKVKKKCTKGRRVNVKNDATKELVGRDRTNRKGRFSVPTSNTAPGDYFAKAKRKKFKFRAGGEQIRVTCKPKKKTISVP